jgi:nucleoside-diphosphate-sugar epimerase
VLVTGANGFLGRHVCSRLLATAAEVHAVSRVSRTDGDGRLHWHQADLEDEAATRRLVAEVKPSAVAHLGGLVNGAPELRFVVPTFRSLLASTVNLLTAAAETGRSRVLLVGSLEEPRAEATEAWPTSPYGAAKWAASAYGRMFSKVFGLPVVIARTHMTYGPGQPSWKIIPYTIHSLLSGDRPRLSSGRRALDWVYVDDVADGLMLAAFTPGLDGATIELGSGTLTPIREIVTRLVALVAPSVEPLFEALPDRPRDAERAADVAATRARIGWTPTTTLDDGLARTVDWYRTLAATEARR